MSYFSELQRSMKWLSEKNDTIFLGQGVVDGGVFMSATLDQVPAEKKIEFIVAEQLQMGVSVGYAMTGIVPISIFPRHNFVLLGLSELVNLLDKLPEMTKGEFIPKVIIRTSAGKSKPIDAGCQHTSYFSEAFRSMLTTVNVVDLHEPEQIFEEYQKAYEGKYSTILTEFSSHYNEK